MRMSADRRAKEGGFTLIESLVALALMGLVLSALANLTAQWLPNWNRGLDRIQRSEMIGITLQRIADDLAAAQYVPASGSDKQPLFAGSEQSVTFVRTAIGPNAGIGLDVVHLSETSDPGGLVTVRTRMPFHPLPPESASNQRHFGEPVLLLRALSAVLCLCGRRPGMAKQLAGLRQTAGQDQIDGARHIKCARDLDGCVRPRPVAGARRLQAAGWKVRR